MRASAARLLHSSVRLGDLSFPATGTLVQRTRSLFINLDNLLSFAKRDRDGRVDGYLVGYLPDEVLQLFFLGGELVNAVSLARERRGPVPIAEAVHRLKSEVERGEMAYCTAPMELLEWMYGASATQANMRFVDERKPERLFPALAEERFTGVLELISNGRVNYLSFEDGRFSDGFFTGHLADQPVPAFLESLFQIGPDGAPPSIAGSILTTVGPIPTQALPSQVRMYRDIYARLASAVEAESPGEGRRRSERASTAVTAVHPVLEVLLPTTPEDPRGVVLSADALTETLAAYVSQVLGELEVISPGAGPRLVREVTRDQRHVLQAAGFYGRLPWPVTW